MPTLRVALPHAAPCHAAPCHVEPDHEPHHPEQRPWFRTTGPTQRMRHAELHQSIEFQAGDINDHVCRATDLVPDRSDDVGIRNVVATNVVDGCLRSSATFLNAITHRIGPFRLMQQSKRVTVTRMEDAADVPRHAGSRPDRAGDHQVFGQRGVLDLEGEPPHEFALHAASAMRAWCRSDVRVQSVGSLPTGEPPGCVRIAYRPVSARRPEPVGGRVASARSLKITASETPATRWSRRIRSCST